MDSHHFKPALWPNRFNRLFPVLAFQKIFQKCV